MDKPLFLPCYVVPVAGPEMTRGMLGLARHNIEGDPFPIRVSFFGILNGDGDSRRSTLSLNFAEEELHFVATEAKA